MVIELIIAFSAGIGVAIFNKYVLNNKRVSGKYTKYFGCCKEDKPKTETV